MEKIGKVVVCLLVTAVFVLPVSVVTNETSVSILPVNHLPINGNHTEIFLPSPLSVNMTYRDAIMSRCSVRTFKTDSVGDEELSTVLWAAYGRRDDGSRTVYGLDGGYSTVIYVFREEAAYTYNAFNHSLVLFEEGDLRRTVNWQHRAPIQLGLVWDTRKNDDANYSSVELGEIGQNIYFMAGALGLSTVTAGLTGFDDIDLPEHEIGRIIMPLGYPQTPPVLEYEPNLISSLPRLQESYQNLKTVIESRREDTSYDGDIMRLDLSQLLWASYGFSYLLDKTDSQTNEVQRHRTVPSASCLYPLAMYAVTESGIFRYYPHILHLNPYSDNPFYSTNWELPVISFLLPIRIGDYRDDIAHASSQPDIAAAPLILISILPLSSTYPTTWYWYYEAGASAYNAMLESTLWDLHAGLVKPTDYSSLRTILRLSNDALPLLIVPVGH